MPLAEPMILSTTSLRTFAPHGSELIINSIAGTSAQACAKWQINTPKRLWMLLAHISVESAGLTTVFEDMNYSAERAHQVWPKWFPTVASAAPYAHNPEKLANHVYGAPRLGNVLPDDGYLLRGQGLMQLTGRVDVQKLATARKSTVDQTRADLTDPKTMFDCACACFTAWGCLPYADRGDVTGCTKVINGGLNGLADRVKNYDFAQRVWPSKVLIGH